MARAFHARLNFRSGGESSAEYPQRAIRHSSRTENFLPDKRGFIRSYRGKRALFDAPQFGGARVVAAAHFVDIFGRKRYVVVSGDTIYSMDGSLITALYTFPTNSNDDSDVHVEILKHQNHVIFLTKEFPPLKWNGDEPVNWLGVREIPRTPSVNKGYRPAITTGLNSYFIDHPYILWDTGHPPVCQLNSETDDTVYRYRIAYMNTRGQIGLWSDYCEIRIPKWPVNVFPADFVFPIVEWQRPAMIGPSGHGIDIQYAVVARTGDIKASPEVGTYFVQGQYPFTQNRITDNIPNGGLSLAIEEDNNPPPIASFGCVYKDHVLLAGDQENPYIVRYSKAGLMEAWPVLNAYTASDVVTALVPLSDRVVVVTKTTVEVLSLDDTGRFVLLRADNGRGSVTGRSLVAKGDNVFGIWTSGYGVHNGFEFSSVPNDYDDLFDYIDPENQERIRAVSDDKGDYWVTVPHGELGGIRYLLMFETATQTWWRVRDADSLSALWADDGRIFCGSVGNIYLLDAGNTSLSAYYETQKIAMEEEDPRAGIMRKALNVLYLNIGSGGDYKLTIELYVDEVLASTFALGEVPARVPRPQMQTFSLDPVWGEAKWDADGEWAAPRRGWTHAIRFNAPVHFNSLRIGVRTPADSYVELAGALLDIDTDLPQPAV